MRSRRLRHHKLRDLFVSFVAIVNKDLNTTYAFPSGNEVHCGYHTLGTVENAGGVYNGPQSYVELWVVYGSAKQAWSCLRHNAESKGFYVQNGQVGAAGFNDASTSRYSNTTASQQFTAAQRSWLKNTVLPRVAPPPPHYKPVSLGC